MLAKVLDYLRYPSTWQGIVGLLGAAGVFLSPEQSTAIAVAGVAVASAISLFFSDADVEK